MDVSKFIAVLASPTDDAIRALLEDDTTVFWIDWRQDDETIAKSCESVLQTGHLSGELNEVDSDEGYEVYLQQRDRRVQVPLDYGGRDRHITLCALNRVLAPECEVRLCIDSSGSDSLAFLPLSCERCAAPEQRYGEAVGQRFYRLAERPNFFADRLPF
jgi:hypothetical protein